MWEQFYFIFLFGDIPQIHFDPPKLMRKQVRFRNLYNRYSSHVHEDICKSIFVAVFAFTKDRKSISKFSNRIPIKYISSIQWLPPSNEWSISICTDTWNDLQHILWKARSRRVNGRFLPVAHSDSLFTLLHSAPCLGDKPLLNISLGS